MAGFPQLARDRQRLDASLLPPGELIAGLMQVAVMGAAERDCEFIAHLHPESSGLGKAQVMGVCRLPATDEARLSSDELQMLFVADALWLAERQDGLINLSRRRLRRK